MFSILFIYPFSKHLSSTFSVLAVMAHAGGSGRPTRLKTPGQNSCPQGASHAEEEACAQPHTGCGEVGWEGRGLGGTWRRLPFPLWTVSYACEKDHCRHIWVPFMMPSMFLQCSRCPGIPIWRHARQCAKHFLCVSHELMNNFRGFYYFQLPRRKPTLNDIQQLF